MTKRVRVKLSVKLVLYALVSLVISAGVFFGGGVLANNIIDRYLYTPAKIIDIEKECLKEFEDYLADNAITSFSDVDSILPWFEGRDRLIIAVYNGGQTFPGSDRGEYIYSSVADAAGMYGLLQDEYRMYWYTSPVTPGEDFMRTKVVKVMYFPMYFAHRVAVYVSAAAAFIAFALSLMLFVRRKTRYMTTLAGELEIMQGGELGVNITVKGNDELTDIARNMDSMRLSFIQRLEHEEEMTLNSSRLLTDMSHDLRTPLTALMGYLEIMESGKYEGREQLDRYIASARKRASQIKEMTDELFEYFLVYSEGGEETETETVDADTLLSQLWDETAFSIESAGFNCVTEFSETDARIDVNIKLIRRVFDNIASNIRKYADRAFPVTARLTGDENMIRVSVSNRVNKGPARGESSGIGLAACRKTAQLHGGTFESKTDDGVFTCVLSLKSAAKQPQENNKPEV